MKQFFALYVKELKANKAIFLFLIILIAGSSAYVHLGPGGDNPEGMIEFAFLHNLRQAMVGILLPAFTLILSLPFLLAHAFNAEWKGETHYQMFALPVSQYSVILAKIAAVASLGLVSGGIATVNVYFWVVKTMDSQHVAVFRIDDIKITSLFDVALIIGLSFVTYVVFILGLVTAIEGVKYAVKRYRGLTAVVFFLISMYLYIRAADFGKMVFEFSEHLPLPRLVDTIIDEPSLVYTTLAGIIFLIIGLVAYEKRAEI